MGVVREGLESRKWFHGGRLGGGVTQVYYLCVGLDWVEGGFR